MTKVTVSFTINSQPMMECFSTVADNKNSVKKDERERDKKKTSIEL